MRTCGYQVFSIMTDKSKCFCTHTKADEKVYRNFQLIIPDIISGKKRYCVTQPKNIIATDFSLSVWFGLEKIPVVQAFKLLTQFDIDVNNW